jgi:superfamily II DNA/RNA helicase
MICTDVASRGLDFKHVSWVLHFDPTSDIKTYVNRVGRTARISESGSSLVFLQSCELEYNTYFEEKYSIKMVERDRFKLMAEFGRLFRGEGGKNFSRIKTISDPEEQQEELHSLRQFVKSKLLASPKLVSSSIVAKNSSLRSYAGHGFRNRFIFSVKKLNITEYARSFGLYKGVGEHSNRRLTKEEAEDPDTLAQFKKEQKSLQEAEKETNDYYKKRLLKAKYKELKKEKDVEEIKQNKVAKPENAHKESFKKPPKDQPLSTTPTPSAAPKMPSVPEVIDFGGDDDGFEIVGNNGKHEKVNKSLRKRDIGKIDDRLQGLKKEIWTHEAKISDRKKFFQNANTYIKKK